MYLRWFDWITAEQSRYDLICCTGDMMLLSHDDLGPEPPDPSEQAVFIARWLAELTVPVALCSGNHELGEYLDIWQAQDPSRIVADDETRVVGRAVVTCTPFDFGAPVTEKTTDALIEGRALADETGKPWLLLHHEPPHETGWEDETRGLLARHAPDFYLCGHIHDWPARKGWATKMGRSWVLNPGVGKREIPDHIVVDTANGILTWNGESVASLDYRD
jgi:Icc-related predicted phosphoesterase